MFRIAAITLVSGVFTLGAGCAHQYMYVPAGPAGGGAAARYPVPPSAPQGEVYVTSFGPTDLEVGPGQPGTLLHARVAVSNGSPVPWTVDGRQQFMAAPGQQPQAATFLNTDAGTGPIYEVQPGRANVFDLYFALPPPLDDPRNLGGFALDWNVNAGGQVVAQQTPFQRVEGLPPSYDAYPPYVAVGLGFGLGWWYGPFYPYPHRYVPAIRGYYYAPGGVRGGPWRGAPPSAWRGAPPRSSGWRGTPPAAGGWRGTPPATSAPLQAAPATRQPSRGGGWRGSGRGGGGHGHGR
jgi:hypothetical protein